MKILLDTHPFIWFIEGNPKLGANARKVIENPENERWLSVASIWEVAIKTGLGKLELSRPFAELENIIHDNDINILPILFNHTVCLSALELKHRDPFDRLIIAQGISEGLKIVSKDRHFAAYDVSLIW